MDELIAQGTVVVGIDGSPAAYQALKWAIEQARYEHRPLTLAYGVDPAGSPWVDAGRPNHRAVLEALREDGLAILRHARQFVAERAPDLAVHETVSTADARSALLKLAERAAMVVIGSRGRGPVKSLLLGSVSVAVSRHAVCPVVVVRPGNRGTVRNGVLAGVDGSERSAATVEFAYRQASLHRLPLTIMHAANDGLRDVDDEAARLQLAEATGGLAEKFPDVRARTTFVHGVPAKALLDQAGRMDLLVLGAPGRGAVSELLSGSVATSVLEHATCPVAIVPAPEH